MVKPLVTKPSQNLGSIVNPKTNEDFNKMKPDSNSPALKEEAKESIKIDKPKQNNLSEAKEKSNALTRNNLIL